MLSISMQYQKRLIIRGILAIVIALNFSIFYKIFSPLTLTLTKIILLPYKPVFAGTIIFIKNHVLEFIPSCTAASAYLLLVLLTLLTDLKLKKAIKTFITGALIILAFNTIRIFILITILIYSGSNLFETMHLFFWKIIATIFVVLTWILLTKIYKIKEIPIYTDIQKLNKLRKQKKKR